MVRYIGHFQAYIRRMSIKFQLLIKGTKTALSRAVHISDLEDLLKVELAHL